MTCSFAQRQGKGFIVRAIEQPSAISLLLTLEDADGLAHSGIGLRTGIPEIIERAKNVIVVSRWKREFQETRIGDLTGGKPSEETSIQQVGFSA